MSVHSSTNGSRAKLEAIALPKTTAQPDRQNLADTAMAGHSTRGDERRRPSTLGDSTPGGEDPRSSKLTPFALRNSEGDSWFVRTGAILSRRTLMDEDDPPPVHAWTHGPAPYLMAAAAGLVTLSLVAFLVFA